MLRPTGAVWVVVVWLVLALMPVSVVGAQTEDLGVTDVGVTVRTDVYGREVPFARGVITNLGSSAYSGITLYAGGFDANGEQVAEGIGYLVNACGVGMLPDFALQPGTAHPFEAALELYVPDAVIDRVEVSAEGFPTEAANGETPIEQVRRIHDDEVVQVEWMDEANLRFGVGCENALFTDLTWYQFNINTNGKVKAVHPRANVVTDGLRETLGLTDPAVFALSGLVFSPQGQRWVYHAAANRVVTAERDGSFQRTLFDDLYNRTLQGIYWFAPQRFLAYYYGAYGDPVVYFTAFDNSSPISLNPLNALLSEIVPGVSPDGRRAIIGGTFFEQTGYYLKALTSDNDPELILESELPGNNFPAPLFAVTTDEAGVVTNETVYLARLVDGAARLQCLDLETAEVQDLSALPIQLATDERAWWWLSPDGTTAALAANGVHGGLWLIDLTAYAACETTTG